MRSLHQGVPPVKDENNHVGAPIVTATVDATLSAGRGLTIVVRGIRRSGSPPLRLPHRPYIGYIHPAEQFNDRLHVGDLPGAARGCAGVASLPSPAHPRMAGGDVVQEVLFGEIPPAVDLQPDEVRALRVRGEHRPCPGKRYRLSAV